MDEHEGNTFSSQPRPTPFVPLEFPPYLLTRQPKGSTMFGSKDKPRDSRDSRDSLGQNTYNPLADSTLVWSTDTLVRTLVSAGRAALGEWPKGRTANDLMNTYAIQLRALARVDPEVNRVVAAIVDERIRSLYPQAEAAEAARDAILTCNGECGGSHEEYFLIAPDSVIRGLVRRHQNHEDRAKSMEGMVPISLGALFGKIKRDGGDRDRDEDEGGNYDGRTDDD